jgi:hypothetical protein
MSSGAEGTRTLTPTLPDRPTEESRRGGRVLGIDGRYETHPFASRGLDRLVDGEFLPAEVSVDDVVEREGVLIAHLIIPVLHNHEADASSHTDPHIRHASHWPDPGVAKQ